jgi:hypothetical protein
VGLYQDNINTQLLIKNGKLSSGMKTKHVTAKFFFIKVRVDDREIKVIDCPAEEMWADVLMKPLHGMAFRTMQAVLTNFLINYKDNEEVQSGKPRLRPDDKSVLTKKMVSWKKDCTTLSHTPQSVLGRTGQTYQCKQQYGGKRMRIHTHC